MTQDRQQPPAVGIIRGPEDFAAAFDVSRETIARLATYEALLRQWQKAVNLVAPSTLDAVWHRHFADSAQLLSLAPTARTWVDLGSGAGFPGLVVAILLASSPSPHASSAWGEGIGAEPPAARVTLIESNARKCAFLREVVRQTGIAASPNPASLWISCRQESKRRRLKLVCTRQTWFRRAHWRRSTGCSLLRPRYSRRARSAYS